MSELINNETRRVETLKGIIRHLHQGQPPALVRQQMRQIVQSVDASEIMAMEQQLIDEGMPVEEIQSMCDLHSQVTRDVLVQIQPQYGIAPGHPVDTFREENKALTQTIAKARSLLAIQPFTNGELLALRQTFHDLMDVEKHYKRKEEALFSCLERHGIIGPAKVMWAKDDEALAMLKQAVKELDSSQIGTPLPEDTVAQLLSALNAIEEMIHKEEKILLPMALQTLTEAEWGEIWISSPQYGWCLVEPRNGYMPSKEQAAVVQEDQMRNGVVQLTTGSTTVEQLKAIFSTLPIDMTFVDANDRVAFFTEGPHRIFARSKAVIGRAVQHCHPPSSVGVVQKILDDFRSGARDLAEFWINFGGRFVHIRYFAVRNPEGTYLGTLELTQDLTPLRALEGERRLLQQG